VKFLSILAFAFLVPGAFAEDAPKTLSCQVGLHLVNKDAGEPGVPMFTSATPEEYATSAEFKDGFAHVEFQGGPAPIWYMVLARKDQTLSVSFGPKIYTKDANGKWTQVTTVTNAISGIPVKAGVPFEFQTGCASGTGQECGEYQGNGIVHATISCLIK
jgi:hypothetical protein